MPDRRVRSGRSSAVIGIDQSAGGTAAVALDESGEILGKLFWVETKKAAKEHGGSGAILSPKVGAGDEAGRTARLEDLRVRLGAFLDDYPPGAAALEDYALARQAYSHFLGEVGAVVRLLLWARRIPFRVYDVQAVKLFATGRGNAEKADVVLACRDRWDADFLPYGRTNGTAGNLADAFAIARLLRTELEVRAGRVELEALRAETRRVLLRTTKQRPRNVLDEPLAERSDGQGSE